ncbi:MAG: T9SS type A sorting domain-containing protein [Candidatus Azobacteroides sp.]|nr:T9SS type A sorting domain-containing protein [Candidatus Azobacteroides sp.]
MLQFGNFSKKLFCGISLVCGLSFVQMLNAQITLEHTFLNERVYFHIDVANGEPNFLNESITSTYPENSYYYTETIGNSYHIKIYNSDYSLNTDQTYQFIPPSGYRVSSVSPSKEIFNTDDNYEFMVKFVKISYASYDNEYYKSILYDINGNIIKDFGTGNNITIDSYLFIINNHYKLLVYRTLYDTEHNALTQTEIYSVPGTPHSSSVSELRANKSQSPYPNPANAVITLPYQLKQGEISVMRIFNINGELIETKQIDSVFDKIQLNVSGYSKGVYIYEVNGISSRFIVN